jgi:ribonuclease-3
LKRSDEQLSELQESIGVAFADAALLEQALVHDSFVSEFPGVFSESNERFEFLGDAVLDLIVAQELVARFPDSPEGHLTQMRASLVNKASLAEIGGGLDLGSWLLVGRGEAEMGGFRRESNLASAFEALVAALFLDQGYDAARDFVVRVMDDELDSVGDLGRPLRHPKSLLHEAVMKRGYSPPVYEVVARHGPDHGPTFTVQALVGSKPMGRGEGKSKQEAESVAAEQALSRLSPCAPDS